MKFTIAGHKFTLHYLAVVGSVAHGLKNKDSDLDLKGVFSWDLSEQLGMFTPQDSLEKSNVETSEWENFLKELKERLNLSIDIEDDVTFMDSKKFVLNVRKNELNMLDLIHSKNVIYVSNAFKKFLEDKYVFLNLSIARSSFKGLSGGAYKEYKRDLKNGNIKRSFKNLARIIHVLYIFLEFNDKGYYSSKLRGRKNLKLVKDIRSGLLSEEFVLNERDRLMTIICELNIKDTVIDKIKMNDMLVALQLHELYEIVGMKR